VKNLALNEKRVLPMAALDKCHVAVAWAAGYFDEYGAACCRCLQDHGWTPTAFRTLDATASYDVLIVIGMNFYPHIWSIRDYCG
jgi:hypothetical protein